MTPKEVYLIEYVTGAWETNLTDPRESGWLPWGHRTIKNVYKIDIDWRLLSGEIDNPGTRIQEDERGDKYYVASKNLSEESQ